MQNPIRILCRKIALRRHQSKNPHSILPLSVITKATVLVDAAKEDAAQTCAAVKQFFDYRQIPVTIYCPKEEELDFLGTIRKKSRVQAKEGGVELFICLIDGEDNVLAEYESRCSTAAFKVGRCAFDGSIYDMTLLGPDGASVTQMQVFASAKDYLNIIR